MCSRNRRTGCGSSRSSSIAELDLNDLQPYVIVPTSALTRREDTGCACGCSCSCVCGCSCSCGCGCNNGCDNTCRCGAARAADACGWDW